MGETTVGHVAGEVVRALYGAGYMESTIGQYRKSIRALEPVSYTHLTLPTILRV